MSAHPTRALSSTDLTVRAPRSRWGLLALSLLGWLAACADGEPRVMLDQDQDGYGSLATGGSDCDDDNPAVSPVQDEQSYDGLDNDCDASTRDDDLDEDGVGVAFDCDDRDRLRYPGATDPSGDGVDQDCDDLDGTDADGDRVASEASGGADCDDADPSVFPGATEICDDAVVNDCDGTEEAAQEQCQWSGEVDLGLLADRKILGEQAGSDAGYAVSLAGDLDGDGLHDVVTGAPAYADDQGDEGAIYVVLSGQPGITALEDSAARVVGDLQRGYVGSDLSTAGDLDGDGLDDLAFGSLYQDLDVGAAFVVYGPVVGVESVQQADQKLSGKTTTYLYGAHTAITEDVDGDGRSDLLVRGEVSIEDGRAGIELYTDAVNDPTLGATPFATIISQSSSNTFGYSSSSGDLDGDGLADLVLGAYGDDTVATDAGAAYVFLGVGPGDLGDADADQILLGLEEGDRAGASLSVGGDTNGDGLADLLIGAAHAAYQGEDRGAAYLFTTQTPGARSVADADLTFRGDRPGSMAGEEVDLRGDLNGDGLQDVVVSNGNGGSADVSPAANVYLSPSEGFGIGGTGADALLRLGSSPYEGVGDLSTGDANGDGISDLLLGAPGYQDAESAAGAVYLLFGSGL